jgi:Do/DeqQ family serine protease
MRRAVLVLAALMLALPAQAAPARKVVPGSQEQVELSFAPLVKRVGPAVVNIIAEKISGKGGVSDDPNLKQLPGARPPNSLGSGVILKSNGSIITNHHVIRGAEAIRVILSDRREFKAEVVQSDERTDLAVLKIEAPEPLPYLEFRDSDEIEVGDLVLAIGNPFGVGQTVTSGIVSAVARTNVGITDFRSFIQTDAAINPGNSGGALVGIDGRLVGINTAIFSRSGGSQGIGFAIPSNMVAAVVQGTAKGTPIVRPWIGARGQTVNNEVATRLGLPRPYGVLVGFLHPNGPAEQAGLRLQDVILAVNGRELSDPEALRYRIATMAVGEKAELRIWRQKAAMALPVMLTAPPEDPPRQTSKIGGPSIIAGATVANLSPALAEELAIPGVPDYGVIVMEIEPGSFADKSSLKAGDVLAKVNGEDVQSVDKLAKLTASSRDQWQLRIRRGNRMLDMNAVVRR